MPKFIDLAEKEISNFIGIKYTSNDLAMGCSCLKENRFIFLGGDAILCGALAQGFDSTILTTLNIYPEYTFEIFKSMKNGDFTQARKKQKELLAIIDRILQEGTTEKGNFLRLKRNYLEFNFQEIGFRR